MPYFFERYFFDTTFLGAAATSKPMPVPSIFALRHSNFGSHLM
jgi:hypothetical protein